jgi:hypothetical protein
VKIWIAGGGVMATDRQKEAARRNIAKARQAKKHKGAR